MGDNSQVSERAKLYPNLKPFKKGQSGNPGGKPKVKRTAEEIALKHAQKAVEEVAKLAFSPSAPDQVRLSALQTLLDRGLGKAKQSVDMNHTMTLNEEFENLLAQVHENKKRLRREMKVIEGGKVVDG